MSKESVYKTLSAIDVRPFVEKKGRSDYLSWAHAWNLIKQQYPQTERVVYECPETGLNYFTDGKTAYVKVGVKVDEQEYIDMLPVMDHRNNSIVLDKVNSFEVNKTIQRATVKAIAMHGLGLSLWFKDGMPSAPVEVKETPPKSTERISLQVDDDNWSKVLKYVVENKDKGWDYLVEQLRTKYKVSTPVQKALKENI
tara:strand:+ start:368 stop:958 length:591 start_codon:yes stop_codon:yes gene_type:complete